MAPIPAAITLEEHFVAPSREFEYENNPFGPGFGNVFAKLTELDEKRIQDMDDGNVARMVISHAPALTPANVESCLSANETLREAVKRHPDRYSGLAILPMGDPEEAVKELERCVKVFGFLGALVGNNHDGRFYDHESFWPIFAKAEELDVPFYIHPSLPTPEALQSYYSGNFAFPAAFGMAANAWSWHTENALHILRLFAAGLFDRHPKLKVIIGHMGEMLPFQLERVIHASAPWGDMKRNLREVWNENIWITTSGMFAVAPMACVLRATKLDHILFSVDYPFFPSSRGLKFLEELKESGLVNDDELAAITYQNAAKLFKLDK